MVHSPSRVDRSTLRWRCSPLELSRQGRRADAACSAVGARLYPFAVAQRLRIYAALAVAAGVAAYLLGAAAPWAVAIGGAAPVLLAATPQFLAGAFRGATTLTPQTEEMSGTEFEDHVAHIARKCGLPVIMTPMTGDWGVDLVVGRRPNRLAIQCKRQSRPVGAGAVQEVVAGAPMHDCAHTMVVTNHEFTPAARKLAEQHGCVLVGGADLTRLGSTIRRLVPPRLS
jgi:restriction system protein